MSSVLSQEPLCFMGKVVMQDTLYLNLMAFKLEIKEVLDFYHPNETEGSKDVTKV